MSARPPARPAQSVAGTRSDGAPLLAGLRGRPDPLGKVIALVLLVIFLLTLVTLCLRVFSNSCPNSRRCCVVQCAVQVQCCCQWKAGRLRILPSGAGAPAVAAGSPVAELHAAAADDARESRGARGPQQQHQLRRANLFPPPPPAYLEIFPEGENREGTTDCQLPSELSQSFMSSSSPLIPFTGEGAASDRLPGSSEGSPAIGNDAAAAGDFNGEDGQVVEVEEEEVGRERPFTPRPPSRAESVEIRFVEPESVAGDTGTSRAEELPAHFG